MIVEILLIPCLLILFTGWGIWAKILIGSKTSSFSLTVLLGFSFFGIITCLLSFFLPLNLYVELVLIILSLISIFFKKFRAYSARFPKEILKSIWFWFFCLIISLVGSYIPFRPDHYFYYTSTLKWLNEYGLIIGVANIEWFLGQMSTFHILQAGIDQTIDPFQRICVFLSVCFLIYVFERKAYLLLFIIPVCFFFLQSPSTDVAIILISLIVVNELCFNYKTENYLVLFLISVFTFTIKPVAFWLPLWVFLAGFILNKNELKDYRLYIISMLIIVIFLTKNVIASSTLFYPVSFTKLDTYWLTDARILELSNENASLDTFRKFFTIDEINSMTFFQKIYHWLSISRLQTVVNCFIVIIIAIFGVFSFQKRNSVYQILWIIVLIKTLLIFSFSGQFRFIIEGIFPLLLIMFYQTNKHKLKIFITGSFFSLLSLVLISYPPLLKQLIPDFLLVKWMKGFTKKSLLIPDYYDIKIYKNENFGNINFNISTYRYDYNAPLPAFNETVLKRYFEIGIFPQMQDPANIRKGYYMKILTPEEKEKLGEIIKMYFPK